LFIEVEVATLQDSQQVMLSLTTSVTATTPLLGINTADTLSPNATTPPLGNSAMDTVSPVVTTPKLMKSNRPTKKKGQPIATSVKDDHNSDVEITANQLPTKILRGFTK